MNILVVLSYLMKDRYELLNIFVSFLNKIKN